MRQIEIQFSVAFAAILAIAAAQSHANNTAQGVVNDEGNVVHINTLIAINDIFSSFVDAIEKVLGPLDDPPKSRIAAIVKLNKAFKDDSLLCK